MVTGTRPSDARYVIKFYIKRTFGDQPGGGAFIWLVIPSPDKVSRDIESGTKSNSDLPRFPPYKT